MMSEEWKSALDPRIAAGLADPISDREKEATIRFNEAYDRLFGPDGVNRKAEKAPARKLSYYEKLVQAMGWDKE